MSAVELRIARQGAVRVNTAVICLRSDNIACIYVDLHSKYATISGVGYDDESGPCLYLQAKDDAKCIETVVEFPEFMGWQVFATDGPARYTLSVCLVKEEQS